MFKKHILKGLLLIILGIVFLALTLTNSTYEIIFIIIGFIIVLMGSFLLGRDIGKIRHEKRREKYSK
ncbi:MAG: hypothetical protein Q4B63_06545 [Clostridium perfringens]|nr:hypothetical protein [Clostridium perfringens]